MAVETRIVTEARLHPDAEWTVLGPGAVELDRLREVLTDIEHMARTCTEDPLILPTIQKIAANALSTSDSRTEGSE